MQVHRSYDRRVLRRRPKQRDVGHATSAQLSATAFPHIQHINRYTAPACDWQTWRRSAAIHCHAQRRIRRYLELKATCDSLKCDAILLEKSCRVRLTTSVTIDPGTPHSHRGISNLHVHHRLQDVTVGLHLLHSSLLFMAPHGRN
jgi:hypothetical protein